MTATVNELDICTVGRATERVAIPDELSIMPDGTKRGPDQRVFRVMTVKDGDKRVVWDATSMSQINEAKKLFEKLKKQGLRPFHVGPGGKPGSVPLDDFDALAEEVVFLPMSAVAGG